MDGTREFFRRIAVLLLSLAVLSERAGGRPAPVRCFVLWVLRRAELAAGACAADAAPLMPVGCPPLRSGDGPDDAARLADRFRALAAMFFALSLEAPLRRQPASRSDSGNLPCGFLPGGRLPRPVAAPRARAPPRLTFSPMQT